MKIWLLAARLLTVALIAGTTGCKAQVEEPANLTSSLPRRPGWTAWPDPIIQTGDFLAKGLWGDPCVIKQGGRFVMYLTTSTQEPFVPPVLPFRAVSGDGIAWQLEPGQPLLPPPGPEFVSTETPSVVYFKGQYHMYYSSIPPAGKVPMMAIGHAVSKDGVVWKHDPAPVLRATGTLSDWNGFLVGEPGALVYEKKVYVYFSAVGARPGGNPPQLQTIAVAVSEDGTNFGPQRSVLGQIDLYSPAAGFVGYSTPAALLHNGRIHLFYDVAHFWKGRDPEWQQVALHHAVSSDGGQTFVQDAGPILTRDQFDWTQGEILAPSVIVDGNLVKMWFGGHVRNKDLAPLILRGFKGREFGVGYATAPVTWLDEP